MNAHEDEVQSSPKKLLVGVSGFTESENRPSGVESILFKVLTDCDDVMIYRFNWNEGLISIVNFIDRACAEWPGLAVSILGYSFGGTLACNAIRKMPCQPIKNLFLIDPVFFKYRYLPSAFSLYGFGTLYVESSVERCHVWRQKISAIRGCTVVRLGDDTNLYEDTLAWRHTKIDNSPAIQGTIVERMQL